MHATASRNHRQLGFTLIEIMVVVVILGVLAALVVPQIMGRPDQAKAAAARSDIQTISMALDIYKLDNHQYPSTRQGLAALVTKPNGTPEPRNWNPDGYLKRMPHDPWGNPYIYARPGVHPGNTKSFDLFSYGVNGAPGGDKNAEIGNWER